MFDAPKSQFEGVEFYGDPDNATCKWTRFGNGCDGSINDCGTINPGGVALDCSPDGKLSMADGTCSNVAIKEPDQCSADGGGGTTPSPIQILTGSKIFNATDFSTTDGLLSVARSYRSRVMGMARTVLVKPRQTYVEEPKGLAGNWRPNWGLELHVEPSLFQIFPYVTVHLPDGTAHVFQRDASGAMVPFVQGAPFGYVHPSTDLKVEFVGTWPVDLSTVPSASTQWRVTDKDDRVWLLETIQLQSSVAPAPYLQARPLTVTSRSGYTQNFTYGTEGQLETITDNLGRTLSFQWLIADPSSLPNTTPGLPKVPLAITEITLPDATKLRYSYGEAYPSLTNLPQADRLEKVERLDVSDNVIDSTIYHYENTDFPKAITGLTDHRGIRIRNVTYDTDGRATLSERAGGTERYTIAYDDTTPPILTRTVTNPLGKVAVHKFEQLSASEGRPSSARFIGVDGQASTNCPSSVTSVAYNATTNFIETETDEEGRVTSYVRDSRGLPTSIIRGFGTSEATTTTYTYHPTLRQPTQMVEPGRTTDFVWDVTSNQLTSMTVTDTTSHTVPYSTNGQTRTTTYAYTGPAGLLASVDGPLPGASDTVSYTYDANGYVATITNEVGHVTTVNAVNGRGQPTQITDANGVVTDDITYDAQGRMKTFTVDPSANAVTTTLDYDAVGQITKITRPDGSFSDYTYSDAKRLTSVTSSDGEKIEYTHDLMGNVTSTVVKTSTGTITYNQTETFDELGRLLQSIGAASQATTYGYEKNNKLKTITDPKSGIYAFGYDAVNRLISETDQQNDTVAYGLDGKGDLTSYTDPRTLATTYVRNGFGDVIQEVSPDRGTTTYVRDERGLMTQMTDARGVVSDYTYDAASRLLKRNYPTSASENMTWSYDDTANGNFGIGRVTRIRHQAASVTNIRITYDARGNVTREARWIGGINHVVLYQYDSADRLTRIKYPSGRIVLYVYNADGKLKRVKTKKDNLSTMEDVVHSINWRPMSRNIQSMKFLGGLKVTNTWTNDYLLKRYHLFNEITSASFIDRRVIRDPADETNVARVNDVLDTSKHQIFSYSAANRLITATGPYGAKTFAYDGVGNRTQEQSTPLGGSQATLSYAYSPTSNQCTAVTDGATTVRSFAYDAAGNTTNDTRSGLSYDYTYNAAGRLSGVTYEGTTRAAYLYNGRNQLASRTLTNLGAGVDGTIHSIHSVFGDVLAETDGVGQTVREYIWIPGAGHDGVSLPIAVVDGVNGARPNVFYVHTDHVSRPIMITSLGQQIQWQAEWGPFGASHSIAGSIANDYRFPGQWFQLEAGLHYNWHRHYDPSLGRYTQPDPLGFVDGPSIYAYALNNPQSFVDNLGLASKNSQTCEKLKRQRKMLKDRIAKREQDLIDDRLNLPERIGPGEALRSTKRGHRTLIQTDRNNLVKVEAEIKRLRCDEDDPPSGTTAAAVAIGLGLCVCIAFPELCIPAAIVGGTLATN